MSNVKVNSRSEAARKAWETRRAKSLKRHRAALKAWRTRRRLYG